MNFLSFFSVFFMVLSLPGLHSCFRAGGFFLQSPDERAAVSSPAGRSVKAIAPAVHCPMHEIKKAEREKGSTEQGKKKKKKKGDVERGSQRGERDGTKERMTDEEKSQRWTRKVVTYR